MEQGKAFSSGKNSAGDTWYVDNYLLLKDYYDMTISRIAARCVRSGNIALEEYKHYSYVLDVLEEISETGEYIITHPDLYGYVDKKMAGGINALKKNLAEFKSELEHNASPEMIKQDKNELNKMKAALGEMDKSEDPTRGAGMSMDEVVNKLMQKNNIKPNFDSNGQLRQQPQTQSPSAPQAVRPAQPQPQGNSRPQNVNRQPQQTGVSGAAGISGQPVQNQSNPQG